MLKSFFLLVLAFPLACIVHSQKIDQSINDRSYQSEMMVSMEPETNEFNNTRLSTSATEQKTLTEKQISEEEIKEFLFGEDAVVNAAQPLEADVAEKKWFPSFSSKLGVGYSDNPMYGPYVREDSNYLEMESELFLLRNGPQHYLTYLYLFGEGKRFDKFTDYDLSGILLAQAEHTYFTDDKLNSYGLRLRHTYYDQAFDFSDLGLPYSLQVQSNKTELIPHFSHQFSDGISFNAEVSGGKEKFEDSSENNSDRQVRVSIDWRPTRKLSVEGKFSGRAIDYKERSRRKSDGTLLTNGKLKNEKIGWALDIKREFSSPLIKDLGIRLMFDELQDNAEGYYDYERLGTGLSYSAEWENWLMEIDLGWNQFRYDQRMVSNGERFYRQSTTNQIILTHSINENWSTYLKLNHEEDRSNSRDYEYFTNFYSIGVSWEH